MPSIRRFIRTHFLPQLNRDAHPSANSDSKADALDPRLDRNVTPRQERTVEPRQDDPIEQPQDNPDPLKPAITRTTRRRGLLRKFMGLFIPKKRIYTPEELFMLEEGKRRKLVEKQLLEEARIFKRLIINVLNRRGLCYRYKKSERDLRLSGVQSVDFKSVRCYPEAFYYAVDTVRLPRDLGILQLVEEFVLTDLSIACGHRVSAHYSERAGCVYIVERATGVLGIPNHVKFDEMLAAFPPYADGLSVPFGLTTNSRPVYKSFSQMYSMLIGGTIGAGKSNFVNAIICTLLRRNPPDRLKFLMIDLKGGLEFSFYEGIPHLLSIPEFAPNGICYERHQVPGVLEWLLNEGERRIDTIKRAGFKDIGRFNQMHRKRHMAHLFLVCDEWADIKLEPRLGARSEDLLTNIASRFRAVGIHVILCTQIPKVEVLTTRIKGVLPAKVAFSVPTNPASLAILDNGHCKGLEPVGRCLLQWSDEMQIQTPFINDATVREIVQGATIGHYDTIAPRGHDVTELEIMTWALQEDSGWLSVTRVYNQFRQRGITRAEIEELTASWEGREFVIGSSLYRVDPPAGSRARRLVAVDDQEEA